MKSSVLEKESPTKGPHSSGGIITQNPQDINAIEWEDVVQVDEREETRSYKRITTCQDLFNRGFKLVPCNENKVAIMKEWQKHPISSENEMAGFPLAKAWGVACGVHSGVTVVDVDPEGMETLAGWEFDHGLITTLRTRTPRGGNHLYFKHVIGIKNGVGGSSGGIPGVDTRNDGGYAIAPTKSGYEFIDPDAEIEEMPDWLIEILRENNYFKSQERPKFSTKEPIKKTEKATKAGAELLSKELSRVKNAKEGTRNSTLNSSAFKVFRHVASGEIPETEAFQSLLTAGLLSGLEQDEVEKTLESAKAAAYELPREITQRRITTNELRAFLQGKGYSFQKNEVTWEIEVIKDGKTEPISDTMEAEIRNLCRDEGISNIGMVNDFILAEAEKNKRNPIKEYFESLTPGTLTIDGFVDRYLKLAPVEEYDGILDVKKYFKIFFKKWLIGAIVRAFTGTHNVTLVLEGAQGIGKSRFVKWLAPTIGKDGERVTRLYVTASISPDSKDDAIRSTQILIWEIAELGATTRRADTEALKAFLSQEIVKVRPPYGKHDIARIAIASYIATVNNESGFLNDPTGNRRFISFSFDRIDTTFENESPDSLWYEAYQAYKAGETPFYTEEEKRIQAILNRQYERESSLLPIMEELFDFTGKEIDFLSTVTIESAVADYVKNNASWLTVKNMDREMKVILEKKGAKKHRMSKGGQRGYQGIVRKTASTSRGYSVYR